MAMSYAVNIEDFRLQAKRRLPKVLFDYIEGGSFSEITLRANRDDLDAIRFKQRMLVDVSNRSLSTTVLGEELSMPLILAPVGSLGSFARRAEIGAARAAERAGIQSCLSTGSICSIEEVAAARKKPYWFQLYINKDRAQADALIDRAEIAGCPVLMVTVDSQIFAKREQSIRNGFTVPIRMSPTNILDMARRWSWLADMAMAPPLTYGNYPGGRRNFNPVLRVAVGGGGDDTLNWTDIARIRQRWKGKLIIKGIMSAEDALLALDHGVDGIVVSNHGGRQMDSQHSSIRVLPRITAAVQKRMTVLFDSGVRRGHDVLKALALGADACLIGRAYAYAVGAAGEAGVDRAIEIFRTDLISVLGFLGLKSVREVDHRVLDTDV
jgi:L-lactate dehydrogenase (cytochrome)